MPIATPDSAVSEDYTERRGCSTTLIPRAGSRMALLRISNSIAHVEIY